MSYCLNPTCTNPKNVADSTKCQSCGSPLVLRDRYRVVKPLGKGGFGATFLAKDQTLPGEPSCVIKQLRPSTTTPDVLKMARELFAREAKTLGKIGNHPQIPRLLDYFEEEEQFFLIQEYISGWTLEHEVKVNGVFSEAGVKQFLSELLPLLQYIHKQKVIHRDIKPANLIRRSLDGRMVLIDFGAVKDQVRQPTISQTGQTALTAYSIGTPGFAPPEQMAMRPVYSSDIYALGVTCIYLLSGKTPKDLGYNPKTGEVVWEPLVQVSDNLINVLRKMLDVSVRSRYQSAQEVLKALDMEPYLESLAQSLLVKPHNNVEQPKYNRRQNSTRNSTTLSNNPSAGSTGGENVGQIASAIRARRAKSESGEVDQLSSADKSANLSTNSNTTSQYKNTQARKINAQTLLTAYLKGRRDFALHNLSFLKLQGVDLSETNFHSAQLQSTNLQGANLHDSDFTRANLNRVNLRNANVSKSYFHNADLEGADLRGADLSHAHFNSANIRGANLCGANLTGAKISDQQLALAKTNWRTIRPNGKRVFFG